MVTGFSYLAPFSNRRAHNSITGCDTQSFYRFKFSHASEMFQRCTCASINARMNKVNILKRQETVTMCEILYRSRKIWKMSSHSSVTCTLRLLQCSEVIMLLTRKSLSDRQRKKIIIKTQKFQCTAVNGTTHTAKVCSAEMLIHRRGKDAQHIVRPSVRFL